MSEEKVFRISSDQHYRELVPRLTRAEYIELRNSIRENGLLNPITVNPQGIILDGHHRYRACTELGVEPEYEIKDFGGDRLQEEIFIFESNIIRRSIHNPFQLFEAAYKMESTYAKRAKKRKMAGLINSGPSAQNYADDTEKGKVSKILSEKIGLSSGTYEVAKRIVKSLSPSDPRLEKLRSGKIKIHTVDRMLKSSQRPRKSVARRGANIIEHTHLLSNPPMLDMIVRWLHAGHRAFYIHTSGDRISRVGVVDKVEEETGKTATEHDFDLSVPYYR